MATKNPPAPERESFAEKVARELDPADLDGAFDRVRGLYGWMQCTYRVVGEDITAAVASMGIVVGAQWLAKGGLRMFVELMLHEFGHPYYAPGDFRNLFRFAQLAAEKIKVPLASSWSFVLEILNVVTDVLVDTQNEDERGGDIAWQTGVLYDGFVKERKRDFSPVEARAGALLLAYPEQITGERFTGCDFPEEVREAARRSVEIAREDITLYDRVDGILEEILGFFLQSREEVPGKKGGGKRCVPTQEELEALSQAIKEARKNGNRSQSGLMEGLANDPEAAICAALDEAGPGAVALAGGYLGYAPELMKRALVKARARRMLQLLAVKGKLPAAPQGYPAGLNVWHPSMPLVGQRGLNVQASIRQGGPRLIPGITTRTDCFWPAPGQAASTKPKRMGVSADVSGSMDKDDTILAICALLFWGAKHGLKVAATLFSDYEKLYPWTYGAVDLIDTLYEDYGGTGGGNNVTGLTRIKAEMEAGDVLFYATDFQIFSSMEPAAAELKELVARGVRVIFFAMFTEQYARQAGVPYYFCPTIEELPALALKIADSLQ
jgi:hypothetical protein